MLLFRGVWFLLLVVAQQGAAEFSLAAVEGVVLDVEADGRVLPLDLERSLAPP